MELSGRVFKEHIDEATIQLDKNYLILSVFV